MNKTIFLVLLTAGVVNKKYFKSENPIFQIIWFGSDSYPTFYTGKGGGNNINAT